MMIDEQMLPICGPDLKAPFPWFGGKSRAAAHVWARFGNVANYVEPFFGSGAVLLGRPQVGAIETVNDLDGFVANFWRSIAQAPEEVAEWANHPVNENDLHARHVWLVQRRETLQALLEGDPDFCDPQIAGWWVWGISCWIAGGWCTGKGPWWPDEHGMLVRSAHGHGVKRQRPHVSTAGQGVRASRDLSCWFSALADRLSFVRVCSGDWSRICGPAVIGCRETCGVFLDPPYADTADRDADIYACDSSSVAHDVRKWAIENGDDPGLRIALCGYEGEHEMPQDWSKLAWQAHGGYGTNAGNRNHTRERIWFSPHCLRVDERQQSLF